MDRHSGEAFAEGPTSPSSVLAGRSDPRQLAAETLLHMYIKERQAGGDLLLLLSELQVGAGVELGGCLQSGCLVGAGLAVAVRPLHMWSKACLDAPSKLPSRLTPALHPLRCTMTTPAIVSFPSPRAQGQFSFVLYDGEKRQVFAARDSSGSEPLYYALDEDGAVSLSNDQPPVPTADEGRVQVRHERLVGMRGMWRDGDGCCCPAAAVLTGSARQLLTDDGKLLTLPLIHCCRRCHSGASCRPATSSPAARPRCSSLR